jgi:hypothetical protein
MKLSMKLVEVPRHVSTIEQLLTIHPQIGFIMDVKVSVFEKSCCLEASPGLQRLFFEIGFILDVKVSVFEKSSIFFRHCQLFLARVFVQKEKTNRSVLDVDECSTGLSSSQPGVNGKCDQDKCINTPGNFTCCTSGFEAFNGSCRGNHPNHPSPHLEYPAPAKPLFWASKLCTFTYCSASTINPGPSVFFSVISLMLYQISMSVLLVHLLLKTV